MTKTLAPAYATDDQLRAAGVDPTASRGVPGLGFIHSDEIATWVGIEQVNGLISLTGVYRDGADGAWGTESMGDQTVFVNATRLVVIEE